MSKQKQNVVIGLIALRDDKTDSKWRPTIHLVQKAAEKGFPIHRLHLLVQPKAKKLAEQLKTKIEQISPNATVQLDGVESLAWEYTDVCSKLFSYIKKFQFDYDKEDYYVHITTGTETAKNGWILLLTNNIFRADVIQSINPKGGSNTPPYKIGKTDDLRRQIATWQNEEQAKQQLSYNVQKYQDIFNEIKDVVELDKGKITVEYDKEVIEDDNSTGNSKSNDKKIKRGKKVKGVKEEKDDFVKSRFLLMGETGTGKTELAKLIVKHINKSLSKSVPFVEVNCACLWREMAMSELCGHEEGAFTGAIKRQIGKLEKADGGVLFLDEIGDLGLNEQAMLLKCIEERMFMRIGGTGQIFTTFRLFCATNKDLDEEVREGRFREDLLSRINLWTYELQPLRERTGEIEEFLKEKENNITFDSKARKIFLDFATKAEWRGNFRDFNNMFKRMEIHAIREKNGKITPKIVNNEIVRLESQWGKRAGKKMIDSSVSHSENMFDPIDYKNDPYYQRLCEKIGKEKIESKHKIDILQLLTVLRCCKGKDSGADAGKNLYKDMNPSSRMKKFLERFELNWQDVQDIVR